MAHVTSAARDIDVLVVFLDVGFLLENTAVFQSQVGEQLVALARLGLTTGVLAVSRDEARFERVLGRRLRAVGTQVFLVKEGSFFSSLWRLAGALRQLTREHRVRHAYVRGLWGPVILALAGQRKRIPYVYDVRGSLVDEMRASGTGLFRRLLYSSLESYCLRNAARVSAVTNPLADHLRRRYRIDAITVVPCCVDMDSMTVADEVAAARRAALGFTPEDCVLVYSGGLSHYQQVPAMLAIWRHLAGEPNVRFLLLTNEDPHRTPMMVGDLACFGNRLIHLSLPREAVAATLAACDIGFMLRDGRELNRVASPVKFPEYLCAGLSVVASPGTGDASRLLLEHDVGTLVDPADIEGGAGKVRELIARRSADAAGYRRRGRKLVETHYEWRAHAATFGNLYGRASAAAHDRVPAEG